MNEFTTNPKYLKGRGAQINPSSRFERYDYDENPLAGADADVNQIRTEFINVHPKTIVNKVPRLGVLSGKRLQ